MEGCDQSESSEEEMPREGKASEEETEEDCSSKMKEDIGTERQERDAFPGRRISEEEKEYFYEGKTKSK